MNQVALILEQTDPTASVGQILAYPIEVILAGALLFIGFTGIIAAWGLFHLVTNMTKSNVARNKIEADLIDVLRDTSTAINTSLAASNRAANASETTTQSVNRMDTDIQSYMDVQKRTILPALRSIYVKIDAIDKRLDHVDGKQLHADISEMRTLLKSVAHLIIREPAPPQAGD